ncbi:ladybird homeobox 1 [Saccoglossus kowalevskii]|uniref:Ladybird homeobox 1 n=1 Tax=Saccoglossus kowalevskii TaxID=10224 RepID=B5THP0_SACKO|nr:ladybird homeobox 1 [Saccoglossus kowalevskii]ACH73248.1 lbx-like homeobox protein [Saccoglossus kowalevskii]
MVRRGLVNGSDTHFLRPWYVVSAMPENKSAEKLVSTRTKRNCEVDPVERLSKVHLPPPANPTKPLTPFSIRDILNSKSPSRRYHRWSKEADHHHVAVQPCRPHGSRHVTATSSQMTPDSPLDALEELTQETFKGLEENIIKTAEAAKDGKKSHLNLFSQRNSSSRKKRKSRTAFTNQQLFELERRFMYQKYLSPGDRDEIASSLGLSSSQVITWFQNRRAKLKRDVEELNNDLSAAKTLTTESHDDDDEDDDNGSVNDGEEDITIDESCSDTSMK